MPLENGVEKRLRELETWAAEHDGRINELWRQQLACNKDLEKRMKGQERSTRRSAPVVGAVVVLATSIGVALGTRIVLSLVGGP